MEFIKQMKKREFIEMTLKTVIAIFAAFMVIILMEGMIYGIMLNAYASKSTSGQTHSEYTVVYCIETGDDKYLVLNHDTSKIGQEGEWTAYPARYSREYCESLNAKEKVFRAPTAFEFTINGIHYVVMAVFIAAVAGFFTYKFVMLSKSYKKIEEEFEKTGTIEISNM